MSKSITSPSKSSSLTYFSTTTSLSFLFGLFLGACGHLTYTFYFRPTPPKPSRSHSHLHHLDLSQFNSNPPNSDNSNTSTDNSDTGNGHSREGSSSEIEVENGSGRKVVGRQKVYQVVLTGGPCAGKSSAISHFANSLRKQGFKVYSVPEVPTLLLNGGAVYPGFNAGQKLVEFETALLELQLQMENSFYKIAENHGNGNGASGKREKGSVILYDRGLLDVAAFLPRELWEKVVNYSEWLRDGMLGVLERYDLIIHLVSAAKGAERFYDKPFTEFTQTLEQAVVLDDKILACYRGHPKHVIVDNSTDFETKLKRAFNHVEILLGLNHPDYEQF